MAEEEVKTKAVKAKTKKAKKSPAEKKVKTTKGKKSVVKKSVPTKRKVSNIFCLRISIYYQPHRRCFFIQTRRKPLDEKTIREFRNSVLE